MELLRLENTTSLSASFSGLTASASYTLELDDLLTGTAYSASATANGSGTVSFSMPSHYLTYTGSLAASVKNSSGDTVIITNVDVVRPYANPSTIASALSIKTSEAIEYERLARYIIDSHTSGFSFVRKEKEVIGSGTDELMIDEPIYRLYKLYENEELMYDSSSQNNESDYKINKQLNAIVLDVTDGSNRINYPKVWRDRYLDIDFFEGYEYLIDGDFGYVVIPQDIKDASELLIQDMVQGNLKYINKYIESFDNDDFKIKFVKGASESTGNKVVDRILEKYQRSFRVGVL
jgi:hypothetical protein